MSEIELNDRVRIQYILDAAREAQSFIAGKTRQSLDTDRMLTLALTKETEIIGEAASKITKEFQQTHSQLPWPAIIGMRNRLIHAYFEVNLDRLWDTVIHALPPLIAELEKILATEDS